MPHTITNTPCSLCRFCRFQVLVSYISLISFIFPPKRSLKMPPKLLALTKSAQSSWIFVTSCGICRSVGLSSRKGVHLHFSIASKNEACTRHTEKLCVMLRMPPTPLPRRFFLSSFLSRLFHRSHDWGNVLICLRTNTMLIASKIQFLLFQIDQKKRGLGVP